MKGKISVIGGDMRSVVAAEEFAKDGYGVCTLGFEKMKELPEGLSRAGGIGDALKDADAVLLPVPFSVDGKTVNAPYGSFEIPIDDVFAAAGNDIPICGGMMGRYALKRNVHDYFDLEELKILNAAATAEGALAIGMSKLKITINGSHAVVIGFGRIGKLLSHKLKLLGAKVTVVTRKRSDAAWCEALGYDTSFVKDVNDALPSADVVYNTVPAMILTEDALKSLCRDAPVIDLASGPGGTDFEAAFSLGIDASLYPGIPGKTVPLTAGRIIKKTVQCYITKGKN